MFFVSFASSVLRFVLFNFKLVLELLQLAFNCSCCSCSRSDSVARREGAIKPADQFKSGAERRGSKASQFACSIVACCLLLLRPTKTLVANWSSGHESKARAARKRDCARSSPTSGAHWAGPHSFLWARNCSSEGAKRRARQRELASGERKGREHGLGRLLPPPPPCCYRTVQLELPGREAGIQLLVQSAGRN